MTLILQTSHNPFAVVVRAHLAAQETGGSATARALSNIVLIRGLYRLGHDRAQVLELLRLIDWLLALPEEVDQSVWREIVTLEGGEKYVIYHAVGTYGDCEGEGRRDN